MDAYDYAGLLCFIISYALLMITCIALLIYKGVKKIHEHFGQGSSDDRDS